MIDDPDVRIRPGDALEILPTLEAESVQCIVTSPPFWGLRDYGHDAQIGLEETPEEWCAKLVAVMREARRVLRSDGVCWIEVGDTYNSGSQNNHGRSTGLGDGNRYTEATSEAWGGHRAMLAGMKRKDLVGAPWLLAFALRADGWYLRSDTIWARPNPMPESVTDRPTKAHSYVFLLTKSARYYYDADAIRESAGENTHSRGKGTSPKMDAKAANGEGHAGWGASTTAVLTNRNARSVWSIPTQPTPWAHFATFPEALVARCILAGTSEHGACGECGAPWRRITEVEGESTRVKLAARGASGYANGQPRTAQALDYAGGHGDKHRARSTTGWEPSCKCSDEWPPEYHVARVPCVVLDPFMGSGTTALVARKMGRRAIGVELNPEYIEIARKRLEQQSLFA